MSGDDVDAGSNAMEIAQGDNAQEENNSNSTGVADDSNVNSLTENAEEGELETIVIDSVDDALATEQDETAVETTEKPTEGPSFAVKPQNFFDTMAQAYLDHEIYKDDSDDEKWELVVKESYDAHETPTESRKPTQQIKQFFLTGLQSRIQSLPSDASDDNTVEQKLCRLIKEVLGDDHMLVAPPVVEPPAFSETNRRGKKQSTRLYFGRDANIFIVMAKIYIKNDLHKFENDNEIWQLAVDEFYEECDKQPGETVVRKKNVKRPFLSGLEIRVKGLPEEPLPEEPEEVTLCRQIRDLRETARAERIKNGEEDPEVEGENGAGGTTKKRKRQPRDSVSRGRPRHIDLEMSPEMRKRYHAVKQERDKERMADIAVEEAELALAEAQKKLQEAKERKDIVAEQAKGISEEFCLEVINEPGPWKEMYDQLVEYHKVNGNCNIVRGQTPEMKNLRKWVLRQRDRYSKPDDHPSKLPWYLAQNLEKLGFVWKYSDGTWEKHYNELIDYKSEHGDTCVPRGYKKNPTLAHWVKRMRHEGNKFKKDPSSVSMTQDQLQKLEDIGFEWNNLSRSWESRFEDFKKFKAEFGHSRIPKVYPANQPLVAWCQNQRAHYRAFKLGKRSTMSASRIQQLENAGFEWDVTGSERSKPRSARAKSRARQDNSDSSDSSSDDDDDDDDEQFDDDQEEAPVAPAFAAVVPPYQANAPTYHPNPFAGYRAHAPEQPYPNVYNPQQQTRFLRHY